MLYCRANVKLVTQSKHTTSFVSMQANLTKLSESHNKSTENVAILKVWNMLLPIMDFNESKYPSTQPSTKKQKYKADRKVSILAKVLSEWFTKSGTFFFT